MGPVGKAAKTSLVSAAFQDLVVVLEASGLASRFFGHLAILIAKKKPIPFRSESSGKHGNRSLH